MRSDLAKVLHPLCGRPLVDYVVRAALGAGMKRPTVVVGHQAERVKEALSGLPVDFVLQAERKGTGHAVMQAEPLLGGFEGDLLVLYGDVPLIGPETLRGLVTRHQKEGNVCTMLTTVLEDPGNYGRIVRDGQGLVSRIVEAKDATLQELAIKEINPAIYCFDNQEMFSALARIRPDNSQGEYYLTDVVAIFVGSGLKVAAVVAEDSREVLGINNPEELAECQAYLEGQRPKRMGG